MKRGLWALMLLACWVMLALLDGCAHPQPPVPPAQQFVLNWSNPNTLPVCASGLAACQQATARRRKASFVLHWDNLNAIPVCTAQAFYPCQKGQVISPGGIAVPITQNSYTGTLKPGTQYQVVIYAYNPAGVLVASKPATVTIP